jgi:uncharacterized membrane protein HdeD (DUF308 family)
MKNQAIVLLVLGILLTFGGALMKLEGIESSTIFFGIGLVLEAAGVIRLVQYLRLNQKKA